MSVTILHNGVIMTPEILRKKAARRKRKRKSCILTSCREDLYYEVDGGFLTVVKGEDNPRNWRSYEY